jgi:hypothetical protein
MICRREMAGVMQEQPHHLEVGRTCLHTRASGVKSNFSIFYVGEIFVCTKTPGVVYEYGPGHR